MRIFLYEFVTGGGWYAIDPEEPPPDSFLAEGSAMRTALAADLASLPGIEVEVLRDERFKADLPPSVRKRNLWSAREAEFAFSDAVERCDAAVLIAPEFDGHLNRCAKQVEAAGKRLLSPHSEFAACASDKLSTHDVLIRAGVPTPRSFVVDREAPPAFAYPFIAKPRDGCGSSNVLLIRSDDDREWRDEKMLVQEYCPGIAASVAVLCGPARFEPLLACTQRLSEENGRFEYLGGECPLPPLLNERAQHLAVQAINSVQAVEVLLPPVGYLGVDLVLGEADDGSQDYVIEINPRLTTSYVGLRVLSKTNLAQAMLDVADGREPKLNWKRGRVRWSADGLVEHLES